MLKLGIIGWGYWGRNYAKYLDTTIEAYFGWVCDLRADMLADAKKRYPNLSVTTDIRDLIRDRVDGVIIATQASSHYRIAKEFLENGIPVLIEKPLAHTVGDAKKLVDISQKSGMKALVGHTFLYNQGIRWLKDKTDGRYFGKLYHLEFKRQSYGPVRNDVNIVWDFAPHDLSIAAHLLKSKTPVTVYAKAKCCSDNTQEDIAAIIIEYPGNILVTVNVAWLYPLKIRTLTLLGSRRMAIFDDTNPVEPLRVYNASLKHPSVTDPYKAAFRLGNGLIPRLAPVDPLYTQMKHFVSYITGKETPLTPLSDGLDTVLLLETISESLRKKREIGYPEFVRRYV